MSFSRSSSPLSELSSVPEDIEMPTFIVTGHGKDGLSSDTPSPPTANEHSTSKRKRQPSPPHEDVLADNEDIAFIVMFRSRFSAVFPPKVIHFGPQDIERGVAEQFPSPHVESLLCAILALVLNRKKPIERGHHGRALEEAIQSNKSQWPGAWAGRNPLSGNSSFNTMNATERLTLLRALIMWSLHSSEAVSNIIKDSYKQSRHDDDLNQPLSVQPWGRDGDKRRYWLIEGRDDTPFRLYRESNPALKHNTWRSVAGSIDELRELADRLTAEDGSQAGRRLSQRITNALPRFEATEDKRKRREYRQSRKALFQRPDPGFSLYEGRTRGKRLRYTFSDEDDEETSEFSESVLGNQRATRNSGAATPSDPSRPTVTASGRQIRSRLGGVYGESLLSGHSHGARTSPRADGFVRSDASEEPRASRGVRRGYGWTRERKHIEGYNSVDEMEDEEDASMSGNDWDAGDEGDDVNLADDVDDDSLDYSDDESASKTLRITLKYAEAGRGRIFHARLPTPSPHSAFQSEDPVVGCAAPSALSTTPSISITTNGYPVSLPPTAPAPIGINGHSSFSHAAVVANRVPSKEVTMPVSMTATAEQAATLLPHTLEQPSIKDLPFMATINERSEAPRTEAASSEQPSTSLHISDSSGDPVRQPLTSVKQQS